ncbi:MAG: dTDP-4-dehydrorhamnose reductase [Paenirhodobacter sp.]|uniref:dTDP-4-dehydrorhamnose reductase n=1 Tax=Paenirhodobacter sp. TaxID=1965326 RepID=UPI003D151F95
MKVLVFGKSGQTATELRRQAEVTALGRDEADLTEPDACAALVRACDADVVINAAAYTAVDQAENDEVTADLVNGIAPAAIARAAADRGIPFVHISTDYVFSGAGAAPWRVEDPIGPLNAYGRSKLRGEQGVIAAGGRSAILRTSWMFSAHGKNFVKTMLRLSQMRDKIEVVEDQIGGPTPAADLAAALLQVGAALADGHAGGIYHFCGQPAVSWADFAREIFAQAGRRVTVTGIPTSAYPTPARRPLNSRMDCSALMRDFGIAAPDWKSGLAKVLQELDV